MATSRQHGIIEPINVKIVSNLDVGAPPSSVMIGEHGVVAPGNQQGQRGYPDKCSVNSSYSGGDKGSLDDQIAKMVDEIEIKVQRANESADNNKNELNVLKKKNESALRQLNVLASLQQLQFKTLLSVKSLRELRGMQMYLIGKENNYSEYKKVYNSVYKEISELISDSENVTQIESSVTNSADSELNLADSELDIEENELESERSEPDLAEIERGNNSLATQPENRTSTPVERPRQEGDGNNTENEAHTVELNRKKNLIISNVPEDLDGGDKEGIEIVLENIGCEGLFQQIENFTRLGEAREDSFRLIKVVMKSEVDVVTVLAKKDRLKDSNSPLVYINKDLSRSERARAYRTRVMRRSTAAESLENSGREWGRNQALEEVVVDFLRQQRHRTTNMGERGDRERRENTTPHQHRHQTGGGGALPEGWEVRRDSNSGRIYYMNRTTRERQGEFPNGPARNYRQDRDQIHREGYQGQNGQGPSYNNRGYGSNGTHMGNYGDWGYQGHW